MLEANRFLRELDLSKNQLDDDFAVKFGNLIQKLAVTTVKFNGNNIGDEGAKEVAKGLVYNSNLQYLGLGGKINDRGTKNGNNITCFTCPKLGSVNYKQPNC